MVDYDDYFADFVKLNTYRELAEARSEGTLEDAYRFIKEIAPKYYDGVYIVGNYDVLLCELKAIERCTFNGAYLLDFSTPFNPYQGPSEEDILDYIIWEARLFSIISRHYELDKIKDVCHLPIDGYCFYVSDEIRRMCIEYGIECKFYEFYPGFSHEGNISWHCKKHCFVIISINSKRYLVDITFAQFFHKHNNHPDRLGILGLEGPSVGYYMMRLKGGEEIARELCTKGYIELDDNVFKTYMDAFMLSFRNGLFYEENGILLPKEGFLPENNIILPYDMDEYMSFLSSSDSQAKYEKWHCLGRQRRPGDPNNPIFR